MPEMSPTGSRWRPDDVAQVVLVDVVVDAFEQPMHLEVGIGYKMADATRELHDRRTDPHQLADRANPRAEQRLQVEIAPLRTADQLQRSDAPGTLDVVYSVVPLVE